MVFLAENSLEDFLSEEPDVYSMKDVKVRYFEECCFDL